MMLQVTICVLVTALKSPEYCLPIGVKCFSGEMHITERKFINVRAIPKAFIHS